MRLIIRVRYTGKSQLVGMLNGLAGRALAQSRLIGWWQDRIILLRKIIPLRYVIITRDRWMAAFIVAQCIDSVRIPSIS